MEQVLRFVNPPLPFQLFAPFAMHPLARISFAVLLIPIAAPLAVAQSTWYVDVLGPGSGSGTLTDPYISIQSAIDASATLDGDTLLVSAGTYRERLDLGGKSLRIRALFPRLDTTVDAGGSGRALTVASGEGPGTLVEGLTFRGGRADRGGGVLVENSQLEVLRCRILDNFTSGDGGGLLVAGGANVAVSECEVFDNVARGEGGGVYGPALMVDCQLERNAATHGGGAYGAQLDNCRLVGNRAGGGTISGDGGGAFGCDVFRGFIRANEATRYGAGAAHSTVRRCRVLSNFVRGAQTGATVRGGGLFACTASDTLISSNGANGVEGFAVADSRLEDCIIRNHTAYEVLVYGLATYDCELVRCVVTGNHAVSPGSIGAGMYGGSAVDCEISFNTVSNFTQTIPADPTTGSVGGGAFGARLERCVILGNRARQGAGLFSCEADHCTIFGGGGESLVAAAAHLDAPGRPDRGRLRSSIVLQAVSSYGTGVLANGAMDVTYSVVTDGAPGVGNMDANPLLTRPEYGDVELLPGSPCIDAGDPAGALDPDGSRADIGARPFDRSACGGPWVESCGFTDVEAAGSLSQSGASTLTIQVRDLEAGVLALRFMGLRNERRLVWPLGYLCIAGPLTHAAPTTVPVGGTFVWVPDPALAAAAGALVGDRVFFQVYFAEGVNSGLAPERLSDMVETTLCP